MNLTADLMRKALETLARKLPRNTKLIVGGGGAMILAHHFPLQTMDIDGIPAVGMTVEELDPLIKQVAAELGLSPDWLNPYYSTFSHVLPSDYGMRLETVCTFPKLMVLALSKTDLLIMKCFAGRMKDRAHAKALIEHGADVSLVEKHIEYLASRNIPKTDEALDFLDEVLDIAARSGATRK